MSSKIVTKIAVYVYNGTKSIILAGFGSWIKILPGQQIVVSGHTPCTTCDYEPGRESYCPGKLRVIDPPGVSSDKICFMQRTQITDENDVVGWINNFSLELDYEFNLNKKNKKEKGSHRLIRPEDK